MQTYKLKCLTLTALVCACMTIQSVCALDDTSYAVGRYWGQDPIEIKEELFAPEHKKVQVDPPSAKEVLDELTTMIDEAKAKAILNPTMENVKDFIILKNKAGNIATRFSQAWQEVLLDHAELDYSTYKPTNNQAIKVVNKINQQRLEQALSKSAKYNGLLYFYNGNDAIAKLQAPIIMRLAKKYQFDVLGVSLDGIYIEDFERNTIDSGQFRRMRVQKPSALFALNPNNGQFLPLSYTMLAEQELEQRLFDVFSNFKVWK